MSEQKDEPTLVSRKRYANGKYILNGKIAERHAKALSDALAKCSALRVVVDTDALDRTLAGEGLEPYEIERAIASLELVDEVYAAEEWRH